MSTRLPETTFPCVDTGVGDDGNVGNLSACDSFRYRRGVDKVHIDLIARLALESGREFFDHFGHGGTGQHLDLSGIGNRSLGYGRQHYHRSNGNELVHGTFLLVELVD